MNPPAISIRSRSSDLSGLWSIDKGIAAVQSIKLLIIKNNQEKCLVGSNLIQIKIKFQVIWQIIFLESPSVIVAFQLYELLYIIDTKYFQYFPHFRRQTNKPKPALHATTLESPTFATRSRSPTKTAVVAVEPASFGWPFSSLR